MGGDTRRRQVLQEAQSLRGTRNEWVLSRCEGSQLLHTTWRLLPGPLWPSSRVTLWGGDAPGTPRNKRDAGEGTRQIRFPFVLP